LKRPASRRTQHASRVRSPRREPAKSRFTSCQLRSPDLSCGFVSKRAFSNQDFLARVRDYLPMDAVVANLDAEGKRARNAVAGAMQEHVFYLFDSEAMLAMSHAIEELALDEANGTLLAIFGCFKDFEPHRERYWQLAATLKDVRVLASGKKPRQHGHLRFLTTRKSGLNSLCAVVYEGGRANALLLGCADPAKHAGDHRFVGFYSLNNQVIARLRQDIDRLIDGRSSTFREFKRQQAIDRLAKQIQAQFAREEAALGTAIRKLHFDGKRYQPRHFAAEFDRSLLRLAQMKVRLPELANDDTCPASR
jgi:hypothetical protein